MNGWLDWRIPRGGIAFHAVCFIFASIVFIFIDGGSAYTRYVCPFFLPIGIGLWLKHSWARWLTFGFFVLIAILTMLTILEQGISIRKTLQGVVVAGSLIALWEWKVYPEDHVEEL